MSSLGRFVSAAARPGWQVPYRGHGAPRGCSWCCISSPGEPFAPCGRRGLSGGACGWHVVGQGDAASQGLCGLAAGEVLMHAVVDLAEPLQGSNLGFDSPWVS